LDLVEKLRDPELLKAMGIGDKLLGTLIVMVLGLAICMMILSIIMLAIKLLRLTSLKKAAPAAVQARPAPVPAPGAPIEEDGELVAAILAAVSILREGRPFTIKNIARAPDRQSWSDAGLADAFKKRK
jgi:Na+-transporting methylmalonyl-CoA/oxaloacetate decarboxylase gamma subunit